jgi:5S rRNA maturation endonuclease (ribonuclease M5)
MDLPATAKQHGPCPACGGKDRFRFDDQEGKGTWFCNQCQPQAGDGFDLVQNVRGCAFPEALQLVADALGYQQRSGDPPRKIVATYNYTDANGGLLFQVVRYVPKDFRQRRPDGSGGWVWNLKEREPVLYKLPHVMQASSVLIVEGEKDVETAYQLGLPDGWAATCNPMGAGKWRESYTEVLAGKHVVILPDADEPGEMHAIQVAHAVQGQAATVGRLTLPEGIKDLSLWAVDRTSTDLHTLLSQSVLWADEVTPATIPPSSMLPEGWPELNRLAVRGVLGDLVRAIEPHSEADVVALFIQGLIAFGSTLNRAAYFSAEADRHHMNLNAVMVGETAKGRKGTSWGYVRRIFAAVDPDWATTRVLNGLSSGEGLIWAVRDEITKDEPVREKGRPTGEYQTVVVDRGITDKRLLVLESEFASTLRVMGRDGNTLSAVIRQAWDFGDLRTMTKNCPAQATGAHISIIAHITKDELCRLIEASEASNGFCNRFLWLCVRRSKSLPEGGLFDETALAPLIQRLHAAVRFGRGTGELRRDEGARAIWLAVYPELSEGKPGLLGAVISRAEAQVMRLACLYALQDMSYVVGPEHLTAALALWEYCEASAKYIFGQRLGDPIADELLTALRKHHDGMTRTDIRDWFGRNRKAYEIDRGLTLLAKQGLAKMEESQSGGRPTERWFAVSRATT